MTLCDCGAPLLFAPDSIHCITCYTAIIARAYSPDVALAEGVCTLCGETLCFECDHCHTFNCLCSVALKETCWVGAVD